MKSDLEVSSATLKLRASFERARMALIQMCHITKEYTFIKRERTPPRQAHGSWRCKCFRV